MELPPAVLDLACGAPSQRAAGLGLIVALGFPWVCPVLTRPGPVELMKSDKIAAWGVLPEDCLIPFILEAS